MRRWFVLLALVPALGCESPAPEDPAPPSFVYPPRLAAWPLGPLTGTVGRGQAPQLVTSLGIAGTGEPLHLPTPWTVPGAGPARAIVDGLVGETRTIELIDVDAGRIAWRDTKACAAPVVGVTADAIVCADASGTRAVGLDGKARWARHDPFLALTDDRVVVGGTGEAVIVSAKTGDEQRVKLVVPKPPARPVLVESIIAACEHELFAYGQDGQLVRLVDGKPAWRVPLATVAALDACTGSTILATTSNPTALVALARETGKVTGTIAGVRGFWLARDGSDRVEVSTAAGIAVWGRDLAGTPTPTNLPALGELLAKRGANRLVRATPLTAVLVDARGVLAYLPLGELGAVLGDRAIVAASWLGSPAETVHRIAIPARYDRALRVAPHGAPIAIAAELRDLPKPVPLDAAGAIAKVDTAKQAVVAVALDASDAHLGYASMLEHAEGDAGVARFDLRARAWSWYRGDGCGQGTPVALAAAASFVACAARTSKAASVIATTRDGAPLWQWRGANVDALQAAAGIVLVFDADQLHVLDGRDGSLLAHYASDDGAAMRATALDVAGMALVVIYQRGRVIARLPRVQMTPAWTFAAAGVVQHLSSAADGVLVELEDGDAYRIDAHGQRTGMPGIDLTWRAAGDVITGQAPGGPIPPAKVAAPPLAVRPPPRPRSATRPPPPDANAPPTLPKVWPAPPPLPASWQYALYELTGGLRARNDYALEPPITPATVRGPGDSPLVVQSGPGLRDVLVLDPHRGDPLRRIQLPDEAAPGLAFSTIVDGKPVVATLLANPLRLVVF